MTKKRKTAYATTILLLIFLLIFGSYTIIDTKNIRNSELGNQNEQTETGGQTSAKYRYIPISITDNKLCYYALVQPETKELENASDKPQYIENEYGKTLAVLFKISKENADFKNDITIDKDGKAFYPCYMTSPVISQKSKERDVIYITKYAYDNAFKPIKDSIAEYVSKSGNSVGCRVRVKYDIDNPKFSCPKYINIQCYSIEDKGKTMNFSFYILNYDKDKIADRLTGEWDS